PNSYLSNRVWCNSDTEAQEVFGSLSEGAQFEGLRCHLPAVLHEGKPHRPFCARRALPRIHAALNK
ncbi:hypothetical protein, partial [Brucella abortus]|uniref:hypothetical protein n=2 Tax=Brucella TaxID=234 RepID=UPI0019D23788